VEREQASDTLRLSIASDEDILAARSQIRAAVLELGFAATDMVRIVTAVSELARNILLYAGRGELRVELISEEGREGVQITAQDEGPGIPDVAKALLDGFSTSGGLGLGLPGTRRLMDEFEIQTEVKRGTVVTVKKWLGEGTLRPERSAVSRSPILSGMAGRTLPGESATGDRSVLRVYPGGVLFAVIDGLGHGPEAAHAAGIAAGVLQGSSGTDIVELVQECHRRLQHSRGVVMTVVSIDTGEGQARWLGVGNVQGMLVHGGNNRQNSSGRVFALLRSGTVGQHLPTLTPSSIAVERGDTFVIATDGISLDFMKEHSVDQPPQLLAERILTQYGLASDDALVLVVRYMGET